MYKIQHSKPYTDREDEKAVSEIITSGKHSAQEETRKFENKFCEFIKKKYAKTTNSGTSALHLALLSLNIKNGDEVIIPSYVCQAVLNSVKYINARPILADIQSDFNEKGYNISAETIKSLINKKTKTIIVPHMFGVSADLESILELEIPIIEDCAQSLGAKYKDKLTGSTGHIGIFSFYATKVISTGQGGMIVTDSEEIRKNLEDLTKYDKRDNYKISYNYNMTDIQAGLGISQLKKLSFFIERRKQIADKYNKAFGKTHIKLPIYREGSFPFRYIIQLNNKEQRDELQKKLKKEGIDAELPVFKPLHLYLNLNKKDFPNTEKAHQTTLSIPLYPSLTDREVDYIINNILEFAS